MDDPPTLVRMRADLAALASPHSAQARALQRVIGWAEYGELKEGHPFVENRVRSLVDLAVQQFSDEAELYAGVGDAEAAEVARRSAAALTPYL